MKRAGMIGLGIVLVGFVAAATAQPPMAAAANGPIFYVKLQGRDGMRVTFYEGPQTSRTAACPVVVSLRPGWIYRVRFDGASAHSDEPIYASLQARDVLRMPARVKASDHPAPLSITTQDHEQVQWGAMVTKVIVLEDPENVLAIPAADDVSAEVEALPSEHLRVFAENHGRPMLTIRMGSREPDASELSGQVVPRFTCVGNPMIGPDGLPILVPPKGGEECVRDGGDGKNRVHFGPSGKLQGLDPADTVAEFTTGQGVRKLVISNPVCVYSPRYVVIRQLASLGQTSTIWESGQLAQNESGWKLLAKQNPEKAKQIDEPATVQSRVRTSANIRVDSTQSTRRAVGLSAVASMTGVGVVEGKEIPKVSVFLPGDFLILQKSASTESARVGDVVTFTIKCINNTNQVMNDVAIVDSLSARFEYIPGTAQADKEAVFLTQDNEAESLILRWELREPLAPGQTATVKFQVKVR